MPDPNMTLVFTALAAVVTDLESGNDSAWTTASSTLREYAVTEEHDEELHLAIEAQELELLQSILEGWRSGKRVMLECDRLVLKRALKAYRKSFKVTVLDAESSLGGGPMSSGRRSTITGIMPPRRYPTEVWDYLVHQGRLLGGGRGIYELPPGG